jgi:myo-inositol-1(or 4)-monophosphatase
VLAPSPDTLLDLARRAADAAGTLLLEGRAGVTVAGTKSTPTDIVTTMDTQAEALLRATLLGARPDDGLLGEESGETAGTSGVRWIVDPLDGTVNYLYGLPGWGVSVAAELDGEIVAAVVAVPTWQTVFTATRGGGARADGQPTHASAVTSLSQALVATGFSYDEHRRAEQATALRELLPRVRDVRRFGAAAADLCLLAAGRVDAFYERGLEAWDLAAGRLIAQESGARVEVWTDPQRGGLVLGAGAALFPAFAALLAEVDA